MLHRRIKKGKMMQSYVMIAYHQSSLKKHFLDGKGPDHVLEEECPPEVA